MSTTPSANNPPPPGLPPASDMLASDGVFTETLRVMGNLTLDKSSIPAVVPAVQNGSEANPFTSIATMVTAAAAADLVINGSSGVIYVADGTLAVTPASGLVSVSNSSVSANSSVIFSFNVGDGAGVLVGNATSVTDGRFVFQLGAAMANDAELLEVHFLVV